MSAYGFHPVEARGWWRVLATIPAGAEASKP